MSSLLLRHGANLSGDASVQYGDKTADVTISVASPIFHVENVPVAATHGTAVIWSTGDGGVSSFGLGMILSDQDIFIQRKNNKGTAEYAIDKIIANVPFYFNYLVGGTTTARLTGSLLVAGTAYGNTVEIKLQNEGAVSANVDMFLFS